MKKIFILLAVLIVTLQALAQSPQKFNYQAVCRSSTGAVVDSQAVNIRISIHDLLPNGTVLYKETHNVTTNTFGLVNIEVGGGTVVSGSFAAIPWATGAKYMEVEIDAGGGYASAGSPQLLSVPYALYANQGGSGGLAGPTGPTGVTGPTGPLVAGASGQTLRNDGNSWVANDIIYNNGTSVGIGTTSPAALLDIQSTNNGVLFPRMTTAQRNAITSPPQSLIIFNTTTNCFETYIGVSWQRIFCGCNGTVPPAPTEATNIPSSHQIVWNWNPAANALGYKWNTANTYGGANDNGTSTTFTQGALDCNTPYTLYIWAYNGCGHSNTVTLKDTTDLCTPCGGHTSFTDTRDNQVYGIVEIGNQCWMKQNLKYHQNSYGNDFTYCYDPPTCNDSDIVYNWIAAMQGSLSSNSYPSGVQGVCPAGWHLPSDTEWVVLETYLGGMNVAGGKMKDTTKWFSPNIGATNSSGFTGFPRGFSDAFGVFSDIPKVGYWWSATESDINNAWYRSLHYDNTWIVKNNDSKLKGFSVRCVKN